MVFATGDGERFIIKMSPDGSNSESFVAVLEVSDWGVDGEVWFEESGNVQRLVIDRMVEGNLVIASERRVWLDESDFG